MVRTENGIGEQGMAPGGRPGVWILFLGSRGLLTLWRLVSQMQMLGLTPSALGLLRI